MIALFVIIIVLLLLYGYLYVGGRVASKVQDRIFDKARDSYSSPRYRMGSVKWQVITITLFWFFLLPCWGAAKAYNQIMDNAREEFGTGW